MTITQKEDRLLYFLCTSFDLKQLIDALKSKYAYAVEHNLNTNLLSAIEDQVLLLEKSRNACSSAAKFLLNRDKVSLN